MCQTSASEPEVRPANSLSIASLPRLPVPVTLFLAHHHKTNFTRFFTTQQRITKYIRHDTRPFPTHTTPSLKPSTQPSQNPIFPAHTPNPRQPRSQFTTSPRPRRTILTPKTRQFQPTNHVTPAPPLPTNIPWTTHAHTSPSPSAPSANNPQPSPSPKTRSARPPSLALRAAPPPAPSPPSTQAGAPAHPACPQAPHQPPAPPAPQQASTPSTTRPARASHPSAVPATQPSSGTKKR
ncbi:hypothetical protein EJ04DRAFT_577392 [Polyplosphaeria fusca]|uniref:Uncharacterized protein n=1 Tax=Polyplosphaeria fusca TaxID=682080 RepID=A0A9P4V2Z2_9PLEO|nr:hypothetical protein EJ04DRAFT_577392 [Polyplosphaeria fusca]